MKKVLHIFPYEKFTFDYIEAINRCFDLKNHMFCIYGRGDKSIEKENHADFTNTIYLNNYGLTEFINLNKMFSQYDKIIFHSLIMPPLLLFEISLCIKRIGFKSFWAIWGADLYDAYWTRNKAIWNKVREVFRKRFIKNINSVGIVRSDYIHLKTWYKVDPKFFTASYTYEFIEPKWIPKDKTSEPSILIGNSAASSCHHKQAIDILCAKGFQKAKIYCPLSYPRQNQKYVDDVIAYGRKRFGDKFIPLTDFLPYEKYMDILSRVDIAILNHNRQQALGNIAALLFYGKLVFVNKANGCFDYFREMGAMIFDLEELNKAFLRDIDIAKVKNVNKSVITDFFSDESFAKRWNDIFESE